ncbi:MAG: tRNA (adenosine(37)-N6)-threonylcarbamoyltransferase complex ATPase subunit type 1 TsaE [Ignavibacteria bacterium]|nr:tRNA (adenosine(37)-N6)-threonylcarbamoyltransferase complex ATPase subunit type 1 TsaE [Ignavibacteria bacterium]
MKIIKSNSPRETEQAGKKYSEEKIEINDIICLSGPLGSGKTVFVKGIASYFQVNGIVNSPTFLIVNEYLGKNPKNNQSLKIFHFDFFRINSFNELTSIGFEEYINTRNSITIIEWPEILEEHIKENIKKVEFSYGKLENQRIIKY